MSAEITGRLIKDGNKKRVYVCSHESGNSFLGIILHKQIQSLELALEVKEDDPLPNPKWATCGRKVIVTSGDARKVFLRDAWTMVSGVCVEWGVDQCLFSVHIKGSSGNSEDLGRTACFEEHSVSTGPWAVCTVKGEHNFAVPFLFRVYMCVFSEYADSHL